MPNLLQKASIVLTPTAYNDGEVLCAKPDDGSGDFDFSRNSAATRVNAQGLVENVQILSSNLVQNPSFSDEGTEEISNGSFSQEGSDIIVNGDFAFNSNWSGTNTIANGQLTKGSGGGLVYQGTLDGTIKSYKVTINVAEKNGVSLNLYLGGNQFSLNEGVQTLYVQSGNSNTFIGFNNGADSIINSISCVEVGQDWFLGNGWSIGEDKAVADGSSGNLNLTQDCLELGKTYTITYTISDYLQGSLRIKMGGWTSGSLRTSNGTYTEILSNSNPSANTSIYFQGINNFNGSITNISVKEVGMDWDLGTGWSIAENKAISDATQGYITQTDVSGAGVTATYKAQWTQNITAGTRLRFFARNYNDGGNVTILSITRDDGTSMGGGNCVGSGTFTAYVSSTNGYSFKLLAEAGVEADITNISVIEITDDTNLPRINYEGFSYQDALGSELITGANSGNISPSSVYTDIYTNASVENGKTYAVTFTAQDLENTIQSWSWTNYTPVDSSILYSNGTNTAYINATGNGNLNLRFYSPSGRTGSLSNISIKEYLGQEVVPNSGCGSWLWEPQATQIVPYSEDFSQWYTLDATSAITYISDLVNPDGTIGGYKISGSGVYLALGLLSTSERNIYARTVSGTGTAQLLSHNTNTNNIFNITEDWQRFDVNLSPSAAPTNFYIDLRGGASTLTELYVWGANATNDQEYPTSYIPTSGSTVTRNQDVCKNGGSLATIDSTEGTLYAEIAALANDGGNRIISLSNGSQAQRVIILFTSTNNQVRAISANNSNQCDISFIAPNVLDYLKVAFKYKQNDFALWVNGIEVGTDTNGITSIGLNELAFDNASGGANFYGKTKAVAVWKEALSDQELADLTYPTPTDPTFSLDFDTIAEQFTFARGSEATYVDAQGLIQSTNEIGEELVVNGDFEDGSTGWLNSNINGFSISNGKLNLLDVAYAKSNFQPNVTTVGKTYKVTFEVSNYVKGQVRLFLGGSVTPAQSSNGVFTFYVTASANTAIGVQTFDGGGTTLSIDNVSVKEYTTATNTPRLDYSTGAEAFLLEPQSTNLVTDSEDYSQWTPTGVSVTSNSTTSPDGLTNGTLLSTNGGTSNRYIRNYGLPTTATVKVLSVYAKANLSNFIQLVHSGDGQGYINFDVSNGIVGTSGTKTTGEIQSVGNGWYRCIAYFDITNVFGASSFVALITSNSVGYGGGATSEDLNAYIWGSQYEEQSFATSYIPSNGSQTTRNQETCINATPEINSEEGVLYAEIAAFSDVTSLKSLSLSDGTNNNRVTIGLDNNNYYYQIRQQGSAVFGGGGLLDDVKLFNKIAISYAENNFSLWINGTKVATDTSGLTPIGLNQLNFNLAAGSHNFYGNTKNLQVYTKALSDAELIKLTT